MGEYAVIKIKEKTLCFFKNYANKEVLKYFYSDEDLNIEENWKYDVNDIEEEPHTRYIYKSTVKRVIERLDSMGFSLKNFEKKFNEIGYESIDYHPFLLHNKKYDYNDDLDAVSRERFDKNITFQKIKNSINKFIKYELEKGNINKYKKDINYLKLSTESDKIIYYSLISDDYDTYYGINTKIIEIPFVFRTLLEYCDIDDEIVFDFTDFQYWSEESVKSAINLEDSIEKTIILVEGKTDKSIIEFALKNIYPNLFDLYYIMDFEYEDIKRNGGSSFVEMNIKTFICSKLKTKFIALFDNDAEGVATKSRLLDLISNIPNNIKIMTYPNIIEFESYPTIFPNGKIVNENINGKACSIELYLPDFLLKENETFYPIEWEARKEIKTNNEKYYSYQGVINSKKRINDNFEKMKKSIEESSTSFVETDWKKMKKLIDEIVFAFK